MFIYHFHRLVRHRLVWGAFAIVTALAFVSAGSCYRAGTTADSVAKIGGKSVPHETFAQIEHAVRGIGRNRDTTSTASEIASQVWERVAANQVAADLGLGVSRQEIRAVLQEAPAFVQQGAFDPRRYFAVLHDVGVTPSEYENYLEQQLLLHKLGSVIEAAAWIPPMELDDELAGWTDQLTLRYASASNRFASAASAVTEAQLRAYYDAHRETFQLPNRVAVEYVALSISNFISRVAVPADDIRAYYDDHAEKFVRTTASNTTESLKFEEARPQIVDILRRELALHAASTNLYHAFLEIARKSGDGFAQAARAFDLPVRRTPLFAADDDVPGIEGGKAFREAAFDLDPSQPEGRFNVVPGEHVVYAIASFTNSPAHMPTFEEAIDHVRPLATAKLREEKFRDFAADAHKELLQALKNGQAFEAAARALHFNVSTSLTFAAHAVTRASFEDSMSVLQAALHLLPGELSDARFTTDGVLFVHMDARVPGDPLSAEMLRAQVRASIARSRDAALMTAWMEWNLNRKGLHVSQKMADSLAASTPRQD